MTRSAFLFSEFETIEVQHGDTFSTAQELSEYIKDLNKEISNTLSMKIIGSDTIDRNRFKTVTLNSNLISLLLLIPMIKLYAMVSRRAILVLLDNCYKFTNIFPNSLLYVTKNKSISNTESEIITLQIHIRMSTLSEISDRYIPSHFYLSWIDFIQQLCDKSRLGLRVGIHTDCDLSNINIDLINENLTSETSAYWRSIGVLDSEGEFNVKLLRIYDKLISQIKLKVNQVEIYSNLNPLESWKIMKEANIFIISRSSFSFVGALLASNSIIVGPRMSTLGPSSWIVTDKINFKSMKKLERRLKEYGLIR